MADINIIAVLVATVGAFIVSGVWYGALGGVMAKLQPTGTSDKMGPWQIAIEIVRSAVVAFALATILNGLGVQGWLEAVGYAALLWLAFPVVLLVGSIVHERVNPKVAALHAGDWLLKLILIAIIVSVWR